MSSLCSCDVLSFPLFDFYLQLLLLGPNFFLCSSNNDIAAFSLILFPLHSLLSSVLQLHFIERNSFLRYAQSPIQFVLYVSYISLRSRPLHQSPPHFISSILLQYNISKLFNYFCSNFLGHSSESYNGMLQLIEFSHAYFLSHILWQEIRTLEPCRLEIGITIKCRCEFTLIFKF